MSEPLRITDCGLATPLGIGKSAVAQALFQGGRDALQASVDWIPDRAVVVGAVSGDLAEIPPASSRFASRNNRLMLTALMEIADRVEQAADRYGRDRVAVVLGTSTSGIAEGEQALAVFRKTGAWPDRYDYRQQETGSLAQFAANWLKLTGPAYTVATACSSSAKVFASARRLIQMGVADAAVVGGADSLCRMTLNGFASLEALSKGHCNPFSLRRDGINIGEGAAAFLLEAEAGPVQLLGVGETSDAYHATAPHPDGLGARMAMQKALADAGLAAAGIAYINLHGTATPLNDAMESKAVAKLFAAAPPCSSTKGMTGHMLGATGGCEAAFLWLTLNPQTNPDDRLPPHLWDGIADPALPPLHFVQTGDRFSRGARTAMLSNTFGFGGSNTALILGHAA
jgi:3-oxoacyl-[acyl-carrier-protein] synthase-1